jgi:hypothetical protein
MHVRRSSDRLPNPRARSRRPLDVASRVRSAERPQRTREDRELLRLIARLRADLSRRGELAE